MNLNRLSTLFYFLQHDIDDIFKILELKLTWLSIIKTQEIEDADFNITNEHSTVTIHKILMKKEEIKSYDSLIETELRRAFLNDLYLIVSRYCIRIKLCLDGKGNDNPSFLDARIDQPLFLLNRFLSKGDKKFLDFFNKIRNSVVHHDGEHNKMNRLDYIHCGTHFLTTEANLGTQIIWRFSEMIEIYSRLKKIYDYSVFVKSELLQKMPEKY
jgi:hypothetical protein